MRKSARFFLQYPPLTRKQALYADCVGGQQTLDFVERQADPLERQNLLQANEIEFAIDSLTGRRNRRRLEQADFVVVANRSHGDSGFMSEFPDAELWVMIVNDVAPMTSFATSINPDATSEARGRFLFMRLFF
jgi:hypothetical protein